MKLVTTFEATPVQDNLMDAILSGQYTVVGFGGGIRSTKTWGTLAVFIALCRMFPGSRWAVIRKDLERLRQTTLPSFEKLRLNASNFVAPVNGFFEAECTNGSRILFRGENIDKDQELLRFHGYEVNGFDLEEADELELRTLHKSIERAGAWVLPKGPQPPPLVFCTFNPNNQWPRRIFYEPWKAGTLQPPYAFVPATIADNPHAPDAYRKNLKLLPSHEYKRFVEGDWESMSGTAIPLTAKHLVNPFKVPLHWSQFGSFDWGYTHPYVFCWWAVNEDGQIYLVDSVWGKGQTPSRIAEAIQGRVPVERLEKIVAGEDVFHIRKAHQEKATPSIAEQMTPYGLYMVPANTARVAGFNRLLAHLECKPDEEPIMKFMRTPNNLMGFSRLQAMIFDPDRPEDILKVNATVTDELGTAGDDFYDCVRYFTADRTAPSRESIDPNLDLNDPRVRAQLQYAQNKVPKPKEAEVGRITNPELAGWA